MIYSKNHFNKNMRFKKKNKKSSLDIIFWIVMAFILIIGFVVFKFVWTEVYAGLQNSGVYEENAKNNLDSVNNNFIPLMDSFYVLVIIGVMIGTIIGAYALRTHPAFYIVAIIFTIIELIIAAPLSNAYVDQISAESQLSSTAQSFTVSHYIMVYLPLFVFVFNAATSIVMYGLGRMEYG